MQDTAIRTVAQRWPFLEPSRDPNYARTDHIKLKPAGAGLTVTFLKGQVVCQKDDGSNEWAKIGTSGYTARYGCIRLIKETVTIDENGVTQLGSVFYTVGNEGFEGTVDAYWRGIFFCQEVVGLYGSGGTNEVQTETVTATGGTRTITVINPITGVSRTTAAIAYNANAAAIQAALELLDNVDAGDIVVTGTGPYVYTFSGTNFAGQNISPLVLGVGSLTGGSSTMAQTTGGVDNLTKVGRLIRGTYLAGEFDLGVGSPA